MRIRQPTAPSGPPRSRAGPGPHSRHHVPASSLPTIVATCLAGFLLAGAVAIVDPAGGERPTLAAPTVADVAVAARPDRASVTAGGTLTWTVDITNRGPDPLPSPPAGSGFWATIGGTLPSRWDVLTATGPGDELTTQAGETTAITWAGSGPAGAAALAAAFDGLAAGETVTYTATVRATATGGPTATTWRVLGGGHDGGGLWFDPDPANNMTTATVDVR